MNFRTLIAAGVVGAVLAGSGSAVRAENPLKSLGSGIKKVRNVLTPWKKSAPEVPDKPVPKAVPVAAAKKPSARKPNQTAGKPRPKKVVHTAAAKPSGTPAPKPESSGEPAEAHPKEKLPAGETAETGTETPDTAIPSEGTPDLAAPAVVAIAALPLAEIPFATPEMGRKGCVRSPYAAEEGLVDVSGIKAGSKVKCPFTQRIFRVP